MTTSSYSEITSGKITTNGHQTAWLGAGPDSGTPIIFVHGWPELGLSWRHQLPVFAGLGFRCFAPDMRGYGQSSTYDHHEAFALEHTVGDLIAFADAMQLDKVIWVGHDWGSPVVWSIATHHAERCLGLASLCVPYRMLELGLDAALEVVDRQLYPVDVYPAGQWEYMRYYEEHFHDATATMDAHPRNTAKLLFRRGNPDSFGEVAGTARTRIDGGWLGDLAEAPDMPLDPSVITEADLDSYAESLARNGFFGPNSWYMNHTRNAEFASRATTGPYLELPVLFLAARYDSTCETITSRMAEPMRKYCRQLTEGEIACGHWMAQEKPLEVNAHLVRWLAESLPGVWPKN